MANTKTITAPPMFPEGQAEFAKWLFGNVGAGQPAYAADLYPNINTTLLPQVYGAWSPNLTDPGTMAMQAMLGRGMPDQIQTLFNNLMQYGGLGWPGQQQSLAAQYGGAGEPAKYMSNIMQFGMPSAAGRPVQQIAQTGGTGSWGNMLQMMALGGGTPAGAQYLMPFLGASPYHAPSMGGGK